jgi:hypothetical protein
MLAEKLDTFLAPAERGGEAAPARGGEGAGESASEPAAARAA